MVCRLTISNPATMFLTFVFSAINIFSSPHYPLRITGNEASVQFLVKTINDELPPEACVQVDRLDAQGSEYGIWFTRQGKLPDLDTRADRFLCGIHYILGDSTRSFHITLVDNDQRVLIGDGIRAVLDVADIGKFNTTLSRDYNAANVLLHELYEQYCLQAVQGCKPGKISATQLRKAHQRAVQKESLLFDLLAIKTHADVVDNHSIYIEFTNRVDSRRTSYVAYYDRGNVERVEANIIY
jgi:hypothetical protein